MKLVQRQIELQNVDARLADEAGETLLDLRLDQGADAALGQLARGGDGGRLRQRELRRDMRIEAGSRSRHRIRSHHVDAARREFRLDRGVYAIDELLRGGPEIGAAGVRRIIRRVDRLARIIRVGRARRRGAAMEIVVCGEVLTDQPRADDYAFALDEAAIGLVAESDLREAGDRQRISEPR